MWSVGDYQEMSLPPSHDTRWDNSAQENLDEISADQADLKKESSASQIKQTILAGQSGHSPSLSRYKKNTCEKTRIQMVSRQNSHPPKT